jgi:hypothetical protein
MWMINIESPEDLLARQLASQQTGFAIPGDGPIQTDGHPVLEYTAPRAFYLSAGSQILAHFDERTHQQLLAPAEKRKILGGISSPEAQLIFSDFMSVNGELYGSVFGGPPGVGVPCVFQAAKSAPQPAASGSLLDQASQAFAAGNLEQARQMVSYILQQNSKDADAGYLLRVIERAAKPLTNTTAGRGLAISLADN